MTMHDLWRMTADVKENAGPVRPSTFDETVGERTEPPVEDYPTGVEGDYAVDTPDDYGYRGKVERPVGVFITDPIPSERPLIEWTGGTATASAIPTSIAGNDRNRARLVFQNLGDTNLVYLLRRRNDLWFTGRAVMPGKEVTMEHNSEVWAACPSEPPGQTTPISWHLENRLEENGG